MRSALDIFLNRLQAWLPIGILFYCVTLCSSSPVNNVNTFDKPRTYIHGDRTCLKCPPGTYSEAPCNQDFKHSNCKTCQVGTFQSHWTQAGRCEQCDSQCLHDEHMVVVKNCTTTQNLECQCMDGYYKHTVDYADVHACLKHTECQEGQIIKKKGTPSSDQECAYCSVDQYYHDGMCSLCSPCNFTVTRNCTIFTNTICSNVSGNETRTNDPPVTQEGRFPLIIGVFIALFLLILFVVVCVLVWRCHKAKLQNNKKYRWDKLTLNTYPYKELRDPSTWTKDVFSFLCNNLDRNWKMFIRNLPGNNHPEETDTRLNQICEEVRDDVPEQIYRALREWKQANEWPALSVESIIKALKALKHYKRLKRFRKLVKKLAVDEQRKASRDVELVLVAETSVLENGPKPQ